MTEVQPVVDDEQDRQTIRLYLAAMALSFACEVVDGIINQDEFWSELAVLRALYAKQGAV